MSKPGFTSEMAHRVGWLSHAGGHGPTTAASAEPPMPKPEVHGGHNRRPPPWKKRVWDGTRWVEVTTP